MRTMSLKTSAVLCAVLMIAAETAACVAGAARAATTPPGIYFPVVPGGVVDEPHRQHSNHEATMREALPTLASAGPFLVRAIEEMTRGDWNAAWSTLYPEHQQVAPLAAFVPCEESTPFPAPLRSIRVTNVRPAAVVVPGAPALVAGAAVLVRVELAWYGPRDPIVLNHTFHLVPAGGHWTWLLSEVSYEAFTQGGCAA